MMKINEVAKILQEKDNFLILCHCFPDGDTLGSGSALTLMLRKIGKKANFICSDELPKKYDYMLKSIEKLDFEPQYIVSVDVADEKLLGQKLFDLYAGKIELAIDHHASNTNFAKNSIVDSTCSACCELIYHLANEMKIEIDSHIAMCLYTGICTDSGCFKYSNTTATTHRIVADLIEKGFDYAKINKVMFDTKSMAKIKLESLALATLEFKFDNFCSSIVITQDMIKQSGAADGDLEGLAPIPIGIEGVKIGLTFRQKRDGDFKISVRTTPEIDASAICALFAGGGHKAASGCTMGKDLTENKIALYEACKNSLKEVGLY